MWCNQLVEKIYILLSYFILTLKFFLTINRYIQEIVIDEANRIVTTPAFMCDTKVHEIHDGVGEMVKAVLKML